MRTQIHEKSRQLIQKGQFVCQAEQQLLDAHLQECPECRAFAEQYLRQNLQFEQNLRDTLRDHIDPGIHLRSAAGRHPHRKTSILKRMRTQMMIRRGISFAATLASFVILFYVFFSLPQFLPITSDDKAINMLASQTKTPTAATTKTPLISRTTRQAAETRLPTSTITLTVKPDGQILFWGSEQTVGKIYASRPDQTGQKILATLPDSRASVSFSPDGSRIALGAARNGTEDWLTVMNIDDSQKEKVLKQKYQSGPAWSPDGKQIAIITEDKYGSWQLSIIDLAHRDAEGQPLVQSIGLNGVTRLPPIWSPDGQKIALAISKSKSYWASPYIVDLTKGKDSQPLLVSTQKFWEWGIVDITWSPDGQQLTYVAWDDKYEHVEIRAVDPDGAQMRTLAKPDFMNPRNMGYTHLAWSNDGQFLSWIAYQEENPGNWSPVLMVLDIQKGEMFRLREKKDIYINNAIWAPAGHEILFGNEKGLWRLDVLKALQGNAAPEKVSDVPGVHEFFWK